MKAILALQFGTLLFLSATCIAATVEYQPPNLTIVAREEPLDSVLKSLGKEMRIYVTMPTGLNPVVNCDIQQKPIKQAFKILLRDMSYSLEWQEKSGRLLGLTILAAGDATASASGNERASLKAAAEPSVPVPVAIGGESEAGLPVEQIVTAGVANSVQSKPEPAVEEVRLADEQQVQEERLKEDVERHDTETAAYIQSQGIFIVQ